MCFLHYQRVSKICFHCKPHPLTTTSLRAIRFQRPRAGAAGAWARGKGVVYFCLTLFVPDESCQARIVSVEVVPLEFQRSVPKAGSV